MWKSSSNPYHCCHAPDIGAGTPFGTKDDFRGSVLTGLNVVGKVVAYPAGITQIGNLDGDSVHSCGDIILTLLLGRITLVERYARDVLSQYVPVCIVSMVCMVR